MDKIEGKLEMRLIEKREKLFLVSVWMVKLYVTCYVYVHA